MKLNTSRGFSLIELLVVMTILTTITSVVLANHSRFNGSVLLGSLAYDIGLSIRQAQVFGLSVRQYSDIAEGFRVGYGVHFSDTSSYIFFADTDENNVYDAGTDQILNSYAVGRGHAISRFCGVTSAGGEECNTSPSPISFLDIVFLRPNPDAVMTSNLTGASEVYSQGIIEVSSPSGDMRRIVVASTGQISVQNP